MRRPGTPRDQSRMAMATARARHRLRSRGRMRAPHANATRGLPPLSGCWARPTEGAWRLACRDRRLLRVQAKSRGTTVDVAGRPRGQEEPGGSNTGIWRRALSTPGAGSPAESTRPPDWASESPLPAAWRRRAFSGPVRRGCPCNGQGARLAQGDASDAATSGRPRASNAGRNGRDRRRHSAPAAPRLASCGVACDDRTAAMWNGRLGWYGPSMRARKVRQCSTVLASARARGGRPPRGAGGTTALRPRPPRVTRTWRRRTRDTSSARPSMPMGMRRVARQTNGFSKKGREAHGLGERLFLHDSVCRNHATPGVASAMEAGTDGRVRDCEWTAAAIDASAPKPSRPRTFGKRAD